MIVKTSRGSGSAVKWMTAMKTKIGEDDTITPNAILADPVSMTGTTGIVSIGNAESTRNQTRTMTNRGHGTREIVNQETNTEAERNLITIQLSPVVKVGKTTGHGGTSVSGLEACLVQDHPIKADTKRAPDDGAPRLHQIVILQTHPENTPEIPTGQNHRRRTRLQRLTQTRSKPSSGPCPNPNLNPRRSCSGVAALSPRARLWIHISPQTTTLLRTCALTQTRKMNGV